MTLKKKAAGLFMIGVILYLLLSVVISFMSSESLPLWLNALVVSIPAFLIPSLIFRRRNGIPASRAPRIGHIFIALALGIGCILLNIALGELNSAITYGMEINSNAIDVKETVAGNDLVTLLVTIAIIPAISEEFFMRGSLLESWRRTSTVGAMILTSVLFGLLHASPSNMLIYFAMGMLFALVYELTRNVWMTVIIHFVNNLLSVLAAYAALNSDPDVITQALEAEATSRAGYISEFLSFLAIALAVIIPMMIILRNSCRKNRIGKYAEENTVGVLPEESYGEADFPAAEPEPIKEPRGAGKLYSEPMLWIGIALLLVLNIASAAMEFGLLDALE